MVTLLVWNFCGHKLIWPYNTGMKILIPFLLALFLTACGGGGGGSTPVVPKPVTYKSTDWNATIGWWSDTVSSSVGDDALRGMIDHINDVGYSGVTFAYSMPVDLNTGIATTPEINHMWTMVDYAYSKGLKVNLKLYWVTASGDNVNQWNTSSYAGWFDSNNPAPNAMTLLNGIDIYTTSLASIANEHHITMIVLGTENDFLTFSQYHTKWADIINHIRSAGFMGTLTYDAIYDGTVADNFYNVAIWDLMDKIGLSFYPDFSATALADLNAAMSAWANRTSASVTSTCAAINNSNAPTTSIIGDLVNIKNTWNKQIIFTENTYQDSQLAGMNWTPVDQLVACGITHNNGGSEQHALIVQAQLEHIKTNLRGVVTGFNMMGYDPWQYGHTSSWLPYDQLTNQAAEAVLKKYLQEGL